MYQIDSELTGKLHYRELLREAEQERLASAAREVKQGPLYRSALYLVGSSMVQLGQRLERIGTSRTPNHLTSATIREP
jgi:hypothetical protein